jgi:predicted peroxiredoxin
MRRFDSLFRTALVALVLGLIPGSIAAQCSDGEPTGDRSAYLFLLSSSDMPGAGAALHLAISALGSDRCVDIALMAGGLELAKKGAHGPVFDAYGLDGAQMLDKAIAAGADVSVCQVCLTNQGIALDALRDGVTKINAYELLDMMETANVVLPFGATGMASMATMPPTTEQSPAAEPEAAVDECDPATDIDGCM